MVRLEIRATQESYQQLNRREKLTRSLKVWEVYEENILLTLPLNSAGKEFVNAANTIYFVH